MNDEKRTDSSGTGFVTNAIRALRDPGQHDDAYGIIFDWATTELKPLIARRFRDRDRALDVDDLFQIVMFAIVQRDDIHSFNNRGELAALIRAIIRNKLVSQYRASTAKCRVPGTGRNIDSLPDDRVLNRLPQPLTRISRQNPDAPAVVHVGEDSSTTHDTLELFFAASDSIDMENVLDIEDLYCRLRPDLQPIFRMMIKGYSNEEIGRELGSIDQDSVRRQVRRLVEQVQYHVRKMLESENSD